MMVSDILSDAVVQIQDYLDNSTAYQDWHDSDLCKKRVYQALEAMEIARICLDSQGANND